MSDDGLQKPLDPFAHPDPAAFDFRPLLLALRECRVRIQELMAATGSRNPLFLASESLLAYIDNIARLTRVPGATKFIRQDGGTT